MTTLEFDEEFVITAENGSKLYIVSLDYSELDDFVASKLPKGGHVTLIHNDDSTVLVDELGETVTANAGLLIYLTSKNLEQSDDWTRLVIRPNPDMIVVDHISELAKNAEAFAQSFNPRALIDGGRDLIINLRNESDMDIFESMLEAHESEA